LPCALVKGCDEINRYADGRADPQATKLLSMYEVVDMAWGYIPMSVFDKNGVEFTDDEGVRVRKQQVRIYSGKAGYRQLLDHIYETVRKSGGRVRQFNFGDEKYLPYADDFVSAHLERMADIKNLDAKF